MRRLMPEAVKAPLRRALGRENEYGTLRLKDTGSIEDLQPFVNGGGLSTAFLVPNHYSFLFPTVDASTTVDYIIRDSDGQRRATGTVRLPHMGTVEVRIDSIDAARDLACGSFCAHVAVPPAVRSALAHPAYFQSRIYTRFFNAAGCESYVHHVERYLICGEQAPRSYYGSAGRFHWAPESPIDWDGYDRVQLLLCNRARTAADVRLALGLSAARVERRIRMAADGAAVVEFSRDEAPAGGRLEVSGLPTEYGRPICLCHFDASTFSASHT